MGGHRSEEAKLARPPPSISPVSQAFVHIDLHAPVAWQRAAISAGNHQRNSSPLVAAPPPPSTAAALPLMSIHSVSRDRFVRVNARGGLRADAEFPWSNDCWFHVLPQLCAQDASPPPPAKEKPEKVEEAEAGDGDGDGDYPTAVLDRRLGNTWFALQSERVGKLLSLHDGREKQGDSSGGAPSRAFVPLAELSPPKKRRRAPRAPHAPGAPRTTPQEWRAPPSACWRLEKGGLRNRGSRGWLNVRPSGAIHLPWLDLPWPSLPLTPHSSPLDPAFTPHPSPLTPHPR